MPLLPNINVGSAPNDGTGDSIRNAFIKVNENFQFIESFFPNTDVANLTANITSTGTSTFNIINAATIGNAGAAFTGASLSAATIGNAGSSFTGASVNAATVGNAGTVFTGTSVSAATIGNSGSVFTGASVSAATIGNTSALLTGTLTTATQPNITSIGPSLTSNVSIQGNIILTDKTVVNARHYQLNSVLSPAGGTFNIGMVASNSQLVSFFMNTDVTLTLVGSIESGVQKDFYFVNNTGSTKFANIFVFSNRTNKGTNSISVSANTVALIKMQSLDTTEANIVAIISNI